MIFDVIIAPGSRMFQGCLTLALAEGGGDAPPDFFLRCKPNIESDRADILHSLWGILCATFGEKKIDRVMSGH